MTQKTRKSRPAQSKSGKARTGRAPTASRPVAATPQSAAEVTLLYSTVRRGERSARGTTHLLARRPAGDGEAARATAEVPLGAASVVGTGYDAAPLRLRGSPAELLFWLRCAGVAQLRAALEECDLDVANVTRDVVGVQNDPDALPATALFSISEDRLRVAVQSLLDLKALLLCRGDDDATSLTQEGGAPVGCRCWVRRGLYDAAVALAQLSEAALPPRSPALVAHDAALALDDAAASPEWVWKDGTEDVAVAPSPVAYASVQERLASVRRLWQLRYNYSVLMPALRRCGTVRELVQLLFSHSRALVCGLRQREAATGAAESSPRSDDLLLDKFVTLPERDARHRQEQQVLSGLLAQANQQCVLRTDTWGSLAVRGALRVRDGVYVVHHAPRQTALRRVLRVAELYGLPPFLRSIRRHPSAPSPTAASRDDRHWDEFYSTFLTSSHGGTRAESSWSPHSTPHYAHLLFLAPDGLDRDDFAAPDPMQAPLVQEELIDLTLKHCGFGLLIGAADQIAYMVKAISEYHTARWERWLARKTASCADVRGVKRESANDDTAVRPPESNAVLRDPMADYVREVCVAASQPNDPTRLRVDWLCDNRWSTEATYYGLVYGVVLETDLDTSLLGTRATAPLELDSSDDDAALSQSELRVQRDAAYYVAAVLELRR